MTRYSPRTASQTGLFLVVTALMLGAAESSTAAPKPRAFVTGQVIVKRKNLATTTTLKANDAVYDGDVIAAGTAATVRFTDGTRVDMAGRSVLEITKPTSVSGGGKTVFRALNGRMAAHLTAGKVIATRTSLVRVKGTIILINVEDDGTSTLSVLEGAAEFYNPCGRVVVPAGAQSIIRPGEPPSDPTAIPDVQALLKEWTEQAEILKPFKAATVQPTAAKIEPEPDTGNQN